MVYRKQDGWDPWIVQHGPLSGGTNVVTPHGTYMYARNRRGRMVALPPAHQPRHEKAPGFSSMLRRLPRQQRVSIVTQLKGGDR